MRGSWIVLLFICGVVAGCTSLSWGYKYNAKPIYNPEIIVVKKWVTQAGDGAKKNYFPLVPAVFENIIFTTDSKGKVTAVDANQGNGLWQIDLKQPISSGPGIGEDLLFMGTADAKVIALQAANGQVVWEKNVTNQVLAAPTYGYGMVFVKTIQGDLLALDAKTGETQWTYTEDNPELILRSSSRVKIAYPFVVSGFANGNLVVLTINKGKLVWEYDVAHSTGFNDLARMVDIGADPLVEDNVIYASSYQGNVAALELTTGKVIWQQKLSSHAGLALSNHSVYVSDSVGRIWALDKTTGQVNWRQNELEGQVLTGPVVYNQFVVVADNEGFVHWLSEKDGHFVSRQFFSKAGVAVSPQVVDNKIIVFGREGTLVALAPMGESRVSN